MEYELIPFPLVSLELILLVLGCFSNIMGILEGITRTPMLPRFVPNAKTQEEVEETYKKEGFSVIEADDVARTIVWLLSEDSCPVFGANINVGACMP